ncbi:MAG: hypothetical protein ACKVHK_07360 [Flavobacteriales bacterium]|jgi:hypothetical protein
MKKLLIFTMHFILLSSLVAQTIPTVTNPSTGRTWMDRNLGASQVATSVTDEYSYGDLYQWGRYADGHQARTSSTTSVLATNNVPNHPEFILANSDWLAIPEDDLWQGVNGINNPCPLGFRIPTEEEFEAERLSWTSNDAAGAFGSPLKLTLAGARSRMTGALGNIGTFVGYRTSAVNGSQTRLMGISFSIAMMGDRDKADGNCVRCILDETSSSVEEIHFEKQLVRITDLLGRETTRKPNSAQLYIYNDNTVEKKIIIE